MENDTDKDKDKSSDRYERLFEKIRSKDTKDAVSELFTASDEELSSSYEPDLTRRD